jgi:hypothetical protein
LTPDDYNKTPVAEWWNHDALTQYPGWAALFVGAGVSIDSHTGLPSGPVLTRALLYHVIDSRAVEDLLQTLQQVSHLLRRELPLPRLERVSGGDLPSSRAPPVTHWGESSEPAITVPEPYAKPASLCNRRLRVAQQVLGYHHEF